MLGALLAPYSANGESRLPSCPTSRKVLWSDCQGSYTYDDWSKYVGEFKDDKRHGQGNMVYPDGRQYSGEFKFDQREGAGVYSGPDGSKWIGAFRNDKPNGRGALYDKSGKVLKAGVWADGAFVGESLATSNSGRQ